MDKLYSYYSYVVIFLVTAAFILVNYNYYNGHTEKIVQYDIKSYYSYLPATFIYKDLTLDYTKENPRLFDKTWPVTLPNGNRLIITSYGMSLMYSPFFFIAHGYASLSDLFEADGYSMPYEIALVVSSVFFLLIGLIFLRKLLLRYYNEWITALVLLLIAAGTNLAFFVTYRAAMPHSFSFALITFFVYYVIKWYEHPSQKGVMFLGFLFGLIVLIRPSNILVLLFFILWDVSSWQEVKTRLLFFIKRFDYVLLMLAMFLIIWMPQFFYWNLVTDHWIFYSYGAKGDTFHFNNPQIWNILFSYKKSWFLYTPIMFFAFIGIFFLLYRFKKAFWAILIFVLANIFLQASWWSWWFGGGFGIRAFIDSYGIMAIPLASLIQAASERTIPKYTITIILLVLAWYNTFQIRQFNNNAIHFWWNSKEAYWENFLKVKPHGNYYDYVRLPDYYLARNKGEYVAIKPAEKKRRDLWRSYRMKYIKRITHDPQIMDSLKIYTAAVEKTIDEAVFELATKNVHSILDKRREVIKERIESSNSWRKFVNMQAKKLNISHDSSLRIEVNRIVHATYE
jgi:hypothetical protein